MFWAILNPVEREHLNLCSYDALIKFFLVSDADIIPNEHACAEFQWASLKVYK